MRAVAPAKTRRFTTLLCRGGAEQLDHQPQLIEVVAAGEERDLGGRRAVQSAMLQPASPSPRGGGCASCGPASPPGSAECRAAKLPGAP